MKIAIIGRTEILYDLIDKLIEDKHIITCIITSKEAPEYLRKKEDYQNKADELNIPIGIGSDIKKFKKILINSESDIAISMNYTSIISQEIIDIFSHGILNIHPGDLPKYRGNACLSWAILNQEEKVALSIHKMIGGELDNGPIIAKSYLAINNKTKILETWNWVRKEAPFLLKKALNKLNEDPNYFLEIQSKNPEDILRCFPRRPEDGKIDWNKSSNYILCLINASSKPYYGAFCFLDEQEVKIWDAEVCLEIENFCAVPGQIISIDNEKIKIACGSGKLIVRELEINGKLTKAVEFIKSIRKRLR